MQPGSLSKFCDGVCSGPKRRLLIVNLLGTPMFVKVAVYCPNLNEQWLRDISNSRGLFSVDRKQSIDRDVYLASFPIAVSVDGGNCTPRIKR